LADLDITKLNELDSTVAVFLTLLNIEVGIMHAEIPDNHRLRIAFNQKSKANLQIRRILMNHYGRYITDLDKGEMFLEISASSINFSSEKCAQCFKNKNENSHIKIL
jgi:hypothetical protein